MPRNMESTMNMLSILAKSFADSSFARLFTEMNAVTILLFVLGIIFCAIEMCMPGFGFFGISGTIMIVAGIIVRIACGGDAMMLLYMILIALVLFFLMFFVISRAITKGRLGKSVFFHVDAAVSEEQTEGTKNFADLVGKVGTVQTALHPVGRASFDGVVVDVVARDGFIEQGATVVCVETEGQRVTVIEQTDANVGEQTDSKTDEQTETDAK